MLKSMPTKFKESENADHSRWRNDRLPNYSFEILEEPTKSRWTGCNSMGNESRRYVVVRIVWRRTVVASEEQPPESKRKRLRREWKENYGGEHLDENSYVETALEERRTKHFEKWG